jgi:hypothetical protein
MKIASTIARIVFGLVFTFAGAMSIYLAFTAGPPPTPGPLGDFSSVAYHTHFVLLPAFVQLVTGVFFLINRFVRLALITTAAVLANILMIHITMQPLGIFPGLVLCICWVLIALPLRTSLLPLLSAV